MTTAANGSLAQQQLVDQFFASLNQRVSHHPAPPPPEPPPEPTRAGSPQAPDPRMDVQPSEPIDLAAEADWLREERQRLEAYTLQQFAQVTQQREELLGRRARVEAEMVLREQEINRQLKVIADRTAALETREQALARAEADLTVRREEAARAEKQTQELQHLHAKLHKDAEQQRLVLEQLRFQTTQAEERVRAAQAEFAAFEQALRSRKQSLEEQQAEIDARRNQLDRRSAAVEKAETALRRREAESEQLEAQVRCELEHRERELTRAAQDLEVLGVQMRKNATPPDRRVNLPGRS